MSSMSAGREPGTAPAPSRARAVFAGTRRGAAAAVPPWVARHRGVLLAAGLPVLAVVGLVVWIAVEGTIAVGWLMVVAAVLVVVVAFVLGGRSGGGVR